MSIVSPSKARCSRFIRELLTSTIKRASVQTSVKKTKIIPLLLWLKIIWPAPGNTKADQIIILDEFFNYRKSILAAPLILLVTVSGLP